MLEGKFENGGKKKKRKKEKIYIQLPRFTIAGTVNSRISLQHGLPSSKTGKDIENLSKVSRGNFVVAKV